MRAEVGSLTDDDLKAAPRSGLEGAKADRAAGWFLFLLTSLIFLALPLPHLADSKYSTLLSQSLIQRRTFNLDSYKIPALAPTQTYNSASNTTVYQIEYAGGHYYHMFP